MSARLCEAFKQVGVRTRVRGHCAAGHTIWQGLLREHTPGKAAGQSLFKLVMPEGTEPTANLRRRWQRLIKGDLAARYLLGIEEDNTLESIKSLMCS